jgi:hypothetical protein
MLSGEAFGRTLTGMAVLSRRNTQNAYSPASGGERARAWSLVLTWPGDPKVLTLQEQAPPPALSTHGGALSPRWGSATSYFLPTACAVGCILSPLRGYSTIARSTFSAVVGLRHRLGDTHIHHGNSKRSFPGRSCFSDLFAVFISEHARHFVKIVCPHRSAIGPCFRTACHILVNRLTFLESYRQSKQAARSWTGHHLVPETNTMRGLQHQICFPGTSERGFAYLTAGAVCEGSRDRNTGQASSGVKLCSTR